MKGEEEGPAGLRELDRHWTLRVKEDAEREQGERVEREEDEMVGWHHRLDRHGFE